MTTPNDILSTAAACIGERATMRDSASERSMARTVKAFNGLTGHQLTETQGWVFMVMLKLARAENGGRFVLDDYVDCAAYAALAGECASNL